MAGFEIQEHIDTSTTKQENQTEISSSPNIVSDESKKELSMLDLVQKDFAGYVGAAVYGYWENMRAMAFDGTGIANQYQPGQFVRANEGFSRLLDQNTGDGTIVALGFLAMEGLLISADGISKKLGKKGFDPTIRFLSSLAFGVGLASYLESTTFMNNTIDLPGDLFGVGLAAAAILTSKLVADLAKEHLTEDNVRNLFQNASSVPDRITAKMGAFATKIETALGKKELTPEQKAQSIEASFSETVNENDLNLL
jgi:hypothetical protein